jgi:hypothetical protein
MHGLGLRANLERKHVQKATPIEDRHARAADRDDLVRDSG